MGVLLFFTRQTLMIERPPTQWRKSGFCSVVENKMDYLVSGVVLLAKVCINIAYSRFHLSDAFLVQLYIPVGWVKFWQPHVVWPYPSPMWRVVMTTFHWTVSVVNEMFPLSALWWIGYLIQLSSCDWLNDFLIKVFFAERQIHKICIYGDGRRLRNET